MITAARMTTTTIAARIMRIAMLLFSLKTTRHSGQEVRLASIETPQFGHVFLAMGIPDGLFSCLICVLISSFFGRITIGIY